MEIPLQEVEACSCLLSCDVNMTVPGQVRADRQSEVFCILDCLQLSVMDMVVLCKGSLLVSGKARKPTDKLRPGNEETNT